MRRLGQEGVDPRSADRGVAVVERALAEERPADPRSARRADRGGGRPHEGPGADPHPDARLRARPRRTRTDGRRQACVRAGPRLARRARPVDRDAALAELARRYLAGHGPAGDRDLAKWAGLPLRDARAGLAAIASQLDARRRPRRPRRPPLRRGVAAAAAARRLRPDSPRLGIARGAARNVREPRDRGGPLPPVCPRRGKGGGHLEHAQGRGRARALRPPRAKDAPRCGPKRRTSSGFCPAPRRAPWRASRAARRAARPGSPASPATC